MNSLVVDFTCAHCLLKVAGYASVDRETLCHPQAGLDCYHLVTVYHHDMPCTEQACVYSVNRRRRRENGTLLADDAIDDAVST